MQGQRVILVLVLVVAIAAAAGYSMGSLALSQQSQGPDLGSRLDQLGQQIVEVEEQGAGAQQRQQTERAARERLEEQQLVIQRETKDALAEIRRELKRKVGGLEEVRDLPTAQKYVDEVFDRRLAELRQEADTLGSKVANYSTEEVKEQLDQIEKQQQAEREARRREQQEKAKRDRLDKIAKELGLDEAQKAQFEELLGRQEEELRAAMEEMRGGAGDFFGRLRRGEIDPTQIQAQLEERRAAFEQTQQEQRDAMAQVLNEDQMAKWEQLQPQQQFGRGIPGMPEIPIPGLGGGGADGGGRGARGQGGQGGGPTGGMGDMFRRLMGGGQNTQGGDQQGGTQGGTQGGGQGGNQPSGGGNRGRWGDF